MLLNNFKIWIGTNRRLFILIVQLVHRLKLTCQEMREGVSSRSYPMPLYFSVVFRLLIDFRFVFYVVFFFIITIVFMFRMINVYFFMITSHLFPSSEWDRKDKTKSQYNKRGALVTDLQRAARVISCKKHEMFPIPVHLFTSQF